MTADEVSRDSRQLGLELKEQGQRYMLALSGTADVGAGLQQQRVGDVLAALRQGESPDPAAT